MAKFRSKKLQTLFGEIGQDTEMEARFAREKAQHPQTLGTIPRQKGYIYVTKDNAVMMKFPVTTQLAMSPQGAVDLAMALIMQARIAADRADLSLTMFNIERPSNEKDNS